MIHSQIWETVMARDDNYFDKLQPQARELIIQPRLTPSYSPRPAAGYPSPFSGGHPHVRFQNPYVRVLR